MCTTHAHADAHNSEHAAERVSDHCGHCSHENLTLEELKGRRAQLDREIAAREFARADAGGLHHTA